MKKKMNKLSPIYSEISDRFATDYLLAHHLHLETSVKIDAAKLPVSLLKSPAKEYGDVLFENIFTRILDSDKKLSNLLKKANVANLGIPK